MKISRVASAWHSLSGCSTTVSGLTAMACQTPHLHSRPPELSGSPGLLQRANRGGRYCLLMQRGQLS